MGPGPAGRRGVARQHREGARRRALRGGGLVVRLDRAGRRLRARRGGAGAPARHPGAGDDRSGDAAAGLRRAAGDRPEALEGQSERPVPDRPGRRLPRQAGGQARAARQGAAGAALPAPAGRRARRAGHGAALGAGDQRRRRAGRDLHRPARPADPLRRLRRPAPGRAARARRADRLGGAPAGRLCRPARPHRQLPERRLPAPRGRHAGRRDHQPRAGLYARAARRPRLRAPVASTASARWRRRKPMRWRAPRPTRRPSARR